MLPSDIAAATYVRKAAMEARVRSEGREPFPWIPRVAGYLDHLVEHDAGGSWVAEVEELVVGFGQALVRGDIWFLAQLFVQPELHDLGIGQELLARTRAYGEQRGAKVYSVISSTSPSAQALYMRAGMYPIGIGYSFSGEVDALLTLPEPDASRKRIVDCSGWDERIADLDRSVFGAERRIDHAARRLPGTQHEDAVASFALVRERDFIGYAYADSIDEQGHIAPVAAYKPADQLPLIRMAAEWLAARDVATASMWVLSQNTTITSALLERGWRVGWWSFFLSSAPFGQFDRYHPFNGLLL